MIDTLHTFLYVAGAISVWSLIPSVVPNVDPTVRSIYALGWCVFFPLSFVQALFRLSVNSYRGRAR